MFAIKYNSSRNTENGEVTYNWKKIGYIEDMKPRFTTQGIKRVIDEFVKVVHQNTRNRK